MARKGQERGPLDDEDELCLKEHMMVIEQTIEAKDLTSSLYSRSIISMDDVEYIENGETRKDRSRKLMRIISMRGADAFQRFIESLETTGYRELAYRLKTCRTIKEKWKDGDVAANMSMKLSLLGVRVDDIEETSHKELATMTSEVKIELQNLATILKTIEELSKTNKKTVRTMNSLQKQLAEKDTLLSAAKLQIKNLQAHVLDLEIEKNKLTERMEQQEKKVASLTEDMTSQRRHQDRDIKEIFVKFKKMEQENKDKENLLKMVTILVEQAKEKKDPALKLDSRPMNTKNTKQDGGRGCTDKKQDGRLVVIRNTLKPSIISKYSRK